MTIMIPPRTNLKKPEEFAAHGPVIVASLTQATNIVMSTTRGPKTVACLSISSGYDSRKQGRPNFSASFVKHAMKLTFEDELFEEEPNAPRERDITSILAFASSHSRFFTGDKGRSAGDKVLFHCHVGHSRSTAAAVICFAATLGRGKEEEAVDLALKSTISGNFYPNSLMIRMADRVLDLEGNLMRAVWPFISTARLGDPVWQLGFENNWDIRMKEIQNRKD